MIIQEALVAGQAQNGFNVFARLELGNSVDESESHHGKSEKVAAHLPMGVSQTCLDVGRFQE